MNQDVSTDTPTRAKSAAVSYRWIALAVLLAVTIGGVLLYWHYAAIYPSTDNAYTGANVVRVASQVSGPVIQVYVEDDERVASRDPLFDIDPKLYDAALRNAVTWLGDNYLLAVPTPRRAADSKPWFNAPRPWIGASRTPIRTRH